MIKIISKKRYLELIEAERKLKLIEKEPETYKGLVDRYAYLSRECHKLYSRVRELNPTLKEEINRSVGTYSKP
jgi:hypothetical protein